MTKKADVMNSKGGKRAGENTKMKNNKRHGMPLDTIVENFAVSSRELVFTHLYRNEHNCGDFEQEVGEFTMQPIDIFIGKCEEGLKMWI